MQIVAKNAAATPISTLLLFTPVLSDWFGLDLCQFTCHFHADHYRDELYAKYGIAFPENIRAAVIKRKAEFLAGRLCAQHALAYLGHVQTDVGIGEHRSPIWPVGVLGAISHSRSRATVLLANGDAHMGVGIDIEDIVSDQQARDLRQQILSEQEFACLMGAGLSEAMAFTVAFSLKESFFKAAYPSVGRYFGFDALRICDLSLADGTLVLEVAKPLCTHFEQGKKLKGRFCQLDATTIATAVVV